MKDKPLSWRSRLYITAFIAFLLSLKLCLDVFYFKETLTDALFVNILTIVITMALIFVIMGIYYLIYRRF